MLMTWVQLKRLLAAIVVIVLLGESSEGSPLAHVDWADVIDDLDCGDLNRGVEVVGDVRYADVTGDGAEEAFVWVVCVHPTSGWPDVLEVFDGSSDPQAPKQIGVLIGEKENLRAGELTFSGNTVTVEAFAYDEQDPNCCPSLRVRQSFSWLGNRFKAGKRTIQKMQR